MGNIPCGGESPIQLPNNILRREGSQHLARRYSTQPSRSEQVGEIPRFVDESVVATGAAAPLKPRLGQVVEEPEDVDSADEVPANETPGENETAESPPLSRSHRKRATTPSSSSHNPSWRLAATTIDKTAMPGRERKPSPFRTQRKPPRNYASLPANVISYLIDPPSKSSGRVDEAESVFKQQLQTARSRTPSSRDSMTSPTPRDDQWDDYSSNLKILASGSTTPSLLSPSNMSSSSAPWSSGNPSPHNLISPDMYSLPPSVLAALGLTESAYSQSRTMESAPHAPHRFDFGASGGVVPLAASAPQLRPTTMIDNPMFMAEFHQPATQAHYDPAPPSVLPTSISVPPPSASAHAPPRSPALGSYHSLGLGRSTGSQLVQILPTPPRSPALSPALLPRLRSSPSPVMPPIGIYPPSPQVQPATLASTSDARTFSLPGTYIPATPDLALRSM